MKMKEVMHTGSMISVDLDEAPVVYDGSIEGYSGQCEKCHGAITLMSKTLYNHVKAKYVHHATVTNPDKVNDINQKYGANSFQKGIEDEFKIKWPLHETRCGKTGADAAALLAEKEKELEDLKVKLAEMEKEAATKKSGAEYE